jgi:hypothetical protein
VKRTLCLLMMVCLAAFLSVGMVGCSGGGGEDTGAPSDYSDDGFPEETEEYTAGEEAIGTEEGEAAGMEE